MALQRMPARMAFGHLKQTVPNSAAVPAGVQPRQLSASAGSDYEEIPTFENIPKAEQVQALEAMAGKESA